MHTPITIRQMLAVVLFAALVLSAGNHATAADQKKSTTLENLMTAFNGESNAHERYLTFAKKADAEGYTKVASLFRAAARSEEVHAGLHAEVIKKMGGTPKANIVKPEVKSTKENLQAAVKGETYEKDVMYPGFLKQARGEKNTDAIRAFNYAKSAEVEHAKFYSQALKNLAQWKGGTKDFYVCTVCGYTVTVIDFQKCPVCFNPKEKYQKVN
jgi:rubrerythrin